MSSRKHRHGDSYDTEDEGGCLVAGMKQRSHRKDGANNYNENKERDYIDSTKITYRYERGYKKHSKSIKRHSKESEKYEKTHDKSKKRHSESPDHSQEERRNRDYRKDSKNRDAQTKQHASKSNGDHYSYSRSKVKDQNLTSDRRGKRYEEPDNNRYESHNRCARLEADSEHHYSRTKEREYKKYSSCGRETYHSSSGSSDYDDFPTRTVSSKVYELDVKEKNLDIESSSQIHKDEEKGKHSREVMKTTKKMISGAYIPPAKLKLMQQEITDKGSLEYQKISWEALKKSINGLTNKVNTSNIADIVKELFKENIIRGRGILVRALMQAQALSPTFTHVYAALVAVINTKFPEITELLLKRLMLQFKRGFRRNDKQACLSSVRFVAHLLNQQVAHEVLVLEILTLLLENPTDHSVEVAIALLKECGKRLHELSRKGSEAIYSRLRNVLHEASIDKRTQYMIEVMFAVVKDKFKDYPAIIEELDLVEENEKFTHLVTLDEAVDAEEILNVFKFDPEYETNEERYKALVKEILGDSDSEESDGSEEDDSDSVEENDPGSGQDQQIVDMTETNLVVLRRNIYLTIQSSLNHEECAHKLLKMEMKSGQIMEMCYMILDCCAQQRTYEKFYGLLAQRFCQLNKVYLEAFMEIFRNSYETIHRLATEKLRNVAKFFAHLLYTDAIHWNVLSNIRLNENDTTSSSRIFIKILFQELCEYMGLPLLNARVKDVTLQEAFDGLFPRDNPHNTRFAINFFTSIGLGGLTDELREHLKTAPKNPVIASVSEMPVEASSSSSSSSSDSENNEQPRKRKKVTSAGHINKKHRKRSNNDKNYEKAGDKNSHKKKIELHSRFYDVLCRINKFSKF